MAKKNIEDKYSAQIKKSEEFTLIKYNTPFKVSIREPPKPKFLSSYDIAEELNRVSKQESRPTHPTVVEDVCSSLTAEETSELLNHILPPKEWYDDYSNLWRQTVGTYPSTRQDVIALETLFIQRLQEFRASPTGLCPVRRKLYTQCFDELMRQIAVICAERGMLLYRIRNESQLTMLEYQKAFESANAFAIRKVLLNLSKRIQLQKKYDQLLKWNSSIRSAIQKIDIQLGENGRTYREQKEEDERKHNAEMKNLQMINQQLKQQLLQFLVPKEARRGW